MKIALLGEAPNDTDSIQALLLKKYSADKYHFFPLLNRIHGSSLDAQKTKRFLRIEYEIEQPDLVIFIRDLDGLADEKDKLKKRKEYFTDFNSVVDKKGIYLLNMYEIEALILADITTFNRLYQCEISPITDPMSIEEPKEYLRDRARNYTESDNPAIFRELIFENTLICQYFEIFIHKLDQHIESFQ